MGSQGLSLLYALAHQDRTRAVIYVAGTGLEWKRWKGHYHEEEESRWSEEERARYYQLKQKERSADEEHEFLVLNEMPNFADREKARELAQKVVLETRQFQVNYETNRLIGMEVDAMNPALLLKSCRELRVPVLIVHPALDPRPLDAVRSLSDALPAAALHVIPDTGHMPWIENPEELRRVLRGFLQTLPS